MRQALIALAIAAQAAFVAAPAFAQPTVGHGPDTGLAGQAATLRHHVSADREDDRIAASRAYDLNNELDRIDDLDARYREGGLTVAERDDLIARLARVQANLSQALADEADSRSVY